MDYDKLINPDPQRMLGYYTLDEHHQPVLAQSVDEASEWFRPDQSWRRIVRQDLWRQLVGNPSGLVCDAGSALLSTVFLVIDHGSPFARESEGYQPLLFETMLFRDGEFMDVDDFTARYCTWDQAVAGHEAAFSKVQMMMGRPPDLTARAEDGQALIDAVRWGMGV